MADILSLLLYHTWIDSNNRKYTAFKMMPRGPSDYETSEHHHQQQHQQQTVYTTSEPMFNHHDVNKTEPQQPQTGGAYFGAPFSQWQQAVAASRQVSAPAYGGTFITFYLCCIVGT